MAATTKSISKFEMYKRLEGDESDPNNPVVGAYDLVEHYQVDIVCPLGVYADDDLGSPRYNFAEQLAQFCAVASLRNFETIGVISVNLIENPTLLNVRNAVNMLVRDRQERASMTSA